MFAMGRDPVERSFALLLRPRWVVELQRMMSLTHLHGTGSAGAIIVIRGR